MSAGQTTTEVYLPTAAAEPKTLWYDVTDAKAIPGGQRLSMATPLEKMPVFQRGGSIVPKRMRVRRSSAAQANDPYTLVIALDAARHTATTTKDLGSFSSLPPKPE